MKLISSKLLCETGLFSVTWDHATDPDGFEIQRGIVQHPGSAVIMPVDAKKRVLLVRQYRLPARKFLWELPAGKIDEGETPLQAAKRATRFITRSTRYRDIVRCLTCPMSDVRCDSGYRTSASARSDIGHR